jgi:hypothetical protein
MRSDKGKNILISVAGAFILIHAEIVSAWRPWN